jgi:hypothetical protein
MPREPREHHEARKPQDEILVGKPIPASQIVRIVYVNPEHVNAIKAIPEGFAQETTMSRSKATALIGRMERAKLVKRGEFKVRTNKEGNKERVMILHAGLDAQTGSMRNVSEEDAALIQRAKKVILTQPDFTHDIKSVADTLGIAIDGHEKDTEYRHLFNALDEARAEIVQEKGGRFVIEKQGRYNVHKWETS